jgi:hypothetical protein
VANLGKVRPRLSAADGFSASAEDLHAVRVEPVDSAGVVPSAAVHALPEGTGLCRSKLVDSVTSTTGVVIGSYRPRLDRRAGREVVSRREPGSIPLIAHPRSRP